MTKLTIGDPAPAFTLPIEEGKTASLSDFTGKTLILYFYPKDDTPGCTKQAIDFSAHCDALRKFDASVLGVSKDTLSKHEQFRKKHDLTLALGSDADGEVVESYGVWVEKNMYGKKFMGIERTTFLIDGSGVISHIWRKVKVAGHVEAVLQTLKEHAA